MRLIVENVWRELCRAWRRAPRRVAVAYYSNDDGLTFADGDVLVVDASDAAITTGQTNAAALRRAVDQGALAFSHPDLHAKVFVLGPRAFIGSANASVNARENLIECMVATDDPISVGASENFVRSIANAGQSVDAAFLDRIAALPVSRTPSRKQTGLRPVFRDPRCWVIGLTEIEYPGDADAAETTTLSIKRRARDGEEVDFFWLAPSRSRFFREAREGDSFIEIDHDGKKDSTRGIKVWPPTRIYNVSEDKDGRRLFHYVYPVDGQLALTWRQFLRLIMESGWKSEPSVQGNRLVPGAIAEMISRRWPA